MTRDYKPQPRRPSSGSGRPLLTGIVIGLFLGLGIALAVAVYIYRTPSPFVMRDVPAPTAAAPGAPPPTAAAPGAATAPAAKGKPRFEFYDLLTRNEEPVSDQEAKRAQETKPAAAAVPPPAPETYFLQAGAFQSQAEAENLKARLALLGAEAAVQAITLPEKGTWYRVRLGPYSKVDEVSRVRQTLKDNGVDSSLVRLREPAAH